MTFNSLLHQKSRLDVRFESVIIIGLMVAALVILPDGVRLARADVTISLIVTANADSVTLDQLQFDSGTVNNLNAFVGSVGNMRSFFFTLPSYPSTYSFTCTTSISFLRRGPLTITYSKSDAEGCLLFFFVKGGTGQGGPGRTNWSPFGPATPNLIIHDYSDFGNMFTAFQNGQVDLTDWAIQAQNLGSFCTNPDMWCSNPDPEFGIFQADINNHAPFLGTALQTARPSLTGSVANVVSGSSSACATGFGQLTLNVVNLEAGSTIYKDSVNIITIANQPSGTPASLPTNDQGGATPTGTYVFPCILAGTYLITGTIVTGKATSGTHLDCGVAAGCTVVIPAGAAGLGGTVSATWNVVWNSPSTITPTAAFPSIMKAIAHLVNKPEFVPHDIVLFGNAACDDTMLSPAHLIQGSPCVTPVPGQPGSPFPASVLTRECSNLALDSVLTSCNPISAYDLADANTGAASVWWGMPGRTVGVNSGYASLPDIDAACQYLISAGFTLSGATTAPVGTGPNTCAELAVNSFGTSAPNATSYTHFTAPSGTHFVVLLRTDPPRARFGQIIADSINMLFGTPNDSGTVLYYNLAGGLQQSATYNPIGLAVPIIFADGGNGLADRWNLYTGGTSLGSTPDSLFANYHSQFGSFDCGGTFNLFPSNYDFHCDPGFDAITNAGEFQAIPNPTLTGAAAAFTDAAVRAYDVPISIPMYSRIQQFAELNAWNFLQTGSGLTSSLVLQKGHGTQTGFWSLLNMRQLPGYAPAKAIYTAGGGSPNLIRWGFSQDPDTVNPYQATTTWDLEIIKQVFDSMLAVNPTTGGANQQVIDWMTTSHSQFFQANELGCITGPSVVATTCFKGITTQTWHLRHDLFFHDSTPVTAQDVVYSILTQRDVPSANGFPSVAFVTNAVALTSDTVQVKLASNSAFYELNIGGVPIVPQHLYQGPGGAICGSISIASTPAGPVNVVANGPASACADPGFDPLTCIGTTGKVAGCGTTFVDGSVQGIFVGSGPYVCTNVGPSTSQAFGKAGGSCIQSSTGALIGGRSMATDSRVFLFANEGYMRGPSTMIDHPNFLPGAGALAKANWADVDKNGDVGILDGSNMAFFFDKTNSYWANPLYTCGPTVTVVDVCVAAAFAVLFDTGNTAPFVQSQLLNVDPTADPREMTLPGGSNTCLYLQDVTAAGGINSLILNCGSSGTTTFSGTFSYQCAAYKSEGGWANSATGASQATPTFVNCAPGSGFSFNPSLFATGIDWVLQISATSGTTTSVYPWFWISVD